MIPDGFFFLRPQWLWLIIPVVIVIAVLLCRTSQGASGAWRQLVDAHLLKQLAVGQGNSTNSRWLLTALATGLLAAIIAMAGPTWQKIEMPSFKARGPAVIVLSLAQSMNAADVSPSRLMRAGHKIRDILERSKGGDLGFIVFSDWPFVASPLTSDVRVIEEMLPELSPDLMPVLGNRVDLALGEAGELLTQFGAHGGEIILLADDIGDQPDKSLAAAKQLASSGYQVNVLGVGTLEGAALRTASGQMIRDANSQPIMTRLTESELTALARAGAGRYARLTAGNADIDQLFPEDPRDIVPSVRANSNLHTDSWNDMGYWLLIVPVLLAPLAFRRGMLMLLPLTFALVSISHSPDADAAWSDWWQTPDQQAAADFEQGDFTSAAGTFVNPAWKASALYRSGQYDQAADLLSATGDSHRDYNLGNSLAHTGEFEKAIEAYDQALKRDPEDADAKFNRDLVAKLLQQQKQKQQKQSDNADQKRNDQQESAQDQRQQGDQEKAQDGQYGTGKDQQSEQQAGTNADEKSNGPSQEASPQTAQSPGDDDQAAGAPADEATNDFKHLMRKAMDEILQGNGEAPPADEKQNPAHTVADKGGISELDQTREQQLRAVPDDSAGLLKARIRQHYLRLRGAQ